MELIIEKLKKDIKETKNLVIEYMGVERQIQENVSVLINRLEQLHCLLDFYTKRDIEINSSNTAENA